ncbi:dynamin-related protein 4C [Trifolium repens]|nr:dynamin-related protein 4C [Trifolium repens]
MLLQQSIVEWCSSLILSGENNNNCGITVTPLDSVGGGIERLLEEPPSISGKREKLSRSVKVLRESEDTFARIMDRIGIYD